LHVDGRIILKQISKKMEMRTGVIWLRDRDDRLL
jgi:hypothetical protein